MIVFFVHRKTGETAAETVTISFVARNADEARKRAAAWLRLTELSARLRPLGYEARWS